MLGKLPREWRQIVLVLAIPTGHSAIARRSGSFNGTVHRSSRQTGSLSGGHEASVWSIPDMLEDFFCCVHFTRVFLKFKKMQSPPTSSKPVAKQRVCSWTAQLEPSVLSWTDFYLWSSVSLYQMHWPEKRQASKKLRIWITKTRMSHERVWTVNVIDLTLSK